MTRPSSVEVLHAFLSNNLVLPWPVGLFIFVQHDTITRSLQYLLTTLGIYMDGSYLGRY